MHYPPEKLQEFRTLLFPAIAQEIITGYNIFRETHDIASPYVLHYYHSDLHIHKDGRKDRHLEELLAELEPLSPVNVSENIRISIRDRIAYYREGEWEENPEGIQIYTLDGRALSPAEAKEYDQPVILEGTQFELSLPVEDRKHLTDILDRFSKILYSDQKDAIHGAWEIPLYIISGKMIRREDMTPITEVEIEDTDFIVATIVKKKQQKLICYLRDKGRVCLTTRKSANKAFIMEYLDR